MAVTLKLKAVLNWSKLNDPEKDLKLQFDTKSDTYDIKVGKTSIIANFCESLLNYIDYIDEEYINELKFLVKHRSAKMSECIAIRKPMQNVDINGNNIDYLLLDMNHKDIMPYEELIKLNENIQRQYDLIKSETETIFDTYRLLSDVITDNESVIKELTAVIDINTDTSKMRVTISRNDKGKYIPTITQSIKKDGIWYENLYGINLKYFQQKNINIYNILTMYTIYSDFRKDIDDWSRFKIPLYIYRLRQDKLSEAKNEPNIKTSLSKTDVSNHYELLCTQYIPHETYIESLSKPYRSEPDTIGFEEVSDYIDNTLNELELAYTKEKVI